jgi:hypothetical protein
VTRAAALKVIVVPVLIAFVWGWTHVELAAAPTPPPHATAQPTQPVDWPTLPDLETRTPELTLEHFEVFAADPRDRLLREAARRWGPRLESIHAVLASRLRRELPATPVRVLFERAYAADCPARGLALGGEAPVIAIFIDEGTPDAQVRAVMAHEMVHAFTFGGEFVGDGVLTEGIANWAAGPHALAWQGFPTWAAAVTAYLDAGTYVSVADPAGLGPVSGEDCLERRDRVYNARAAFTGWLAGRVGLERVLAMPAREVTIVDPDDGEPRTQAMPDYEEASGFALDELEPLFLADVTGAL